MIVKRRGNRVMCFGMMILLMLQLCAARNRQEVFCGAQGKCGYED